MACAVALSGCLSESVEQRHVTINPDGSGVLSFVTAYNSTNATEVAQKLKELGSRQGRAKFRKLGMLNVKQDRKSVV